MNNKELNNQDLNNISGGKHNLEDYLKEIKKDKEKPLVDYGTGKHLDLDPSIHWEDENNAHIIKREKDKPKKYEK